MPTQVRREEECSSGRLEKFRVHRSTHRRRHGGAWSWATEGCAGLGTPHTNGTDGLVGESDGRCRAERPSRGHCVTITGLSGALHSERCDWAAYQCVCELGARESAAYRSAMQQMAHTSQASAERLRLWIATIFSAAVGLPLAKSNGASLLRQVMRDWRQDKSLLARRILALHAGWAMVVVGFVPFVWEVILGTWDAARVGDWTRYAAVGPWGTMVLLQMMRKQHIYAACMVRQCPSRNSLEV